MHSKQPVIVERFCCFFFLVELQITLVFTISVYFSLEVNVCALSLDSTRASS